MPASSNSEFARLSIRRFSKSEQFEITLASQFPSLQPFKLRRLIIDPIASSLVSALSSYLPGSVTDSHSYNVVSRFRFFKFFAIFTKLKPLFSDKSSSTKFGNASVFLNTLISSSVWLFKSMLTRCSSSSEWDTNPNLGVSIQHARVYPNSL